jgi:hypothetical protein
MKYSYPDSLITLTAAVTLACSQAINKYATGVSVIKNNSSMFLKGVTNNYKGRTLVGIKFDNISAGKYFVLIHTSQQYAVMNKTIEKSELIPAESHVTLEKSELVREYGRNEPSVRCQSTFL